MHGDWGAVAVYCREPFRPQASIAAALQCFPMAAVYGSFVMAVRNIGGVDLDGDGPDGPAGSRRPYGEDGGKTLGSGDRMPQGNFQGPA